MTAQATEIEVELRDPGGRVAGTLALRVYGREAVPEQWTNTILNCRPEEGRPGVRRPRPPAYWPADALELAAHLVGVEQP